jgi:hypothetical protein
MLEPRDLGAEIVFVKRFEGGGGLADDVGVDLGS